MNLENISLKKLDYQNKMTNNRMNETKNQTNRLYMYGLQSIQIKTPNRSIRSMPSKKNKENPQIVSIHNFILLFILLKRFQSIT